MRGRRAAEADAKGAPRGFFAPQLQQVSREAQLRILHCWFGHAHEERHICIDTTASGGNATLLGEVS